MRYLTGLLFLTFLVLISCRERTDFEKSLIANSWVYFEDETLDSINNSSAIAYMTFNDDGTSETFYLKSDRVYESLICTPNIKEEANDKWSFNETDSILTVYKIPFKLVSASNDTIAMKRLDRGYNVVFVNKIYFDKEGKRIK
ncbi:hypothetical protein [Flavobacterium beibuense]|uniref:hypothetical protein n=1 Tax=Flavobacterium beibuense TaxID=657326 RepID=UPI003A8E86E2